MRDFSPSVVNGLFFERLSFGLVPMSIMGVRIVPPQTYSGSNVAIGEPTASQNAHCTHKFGCSRPLQYMVHCHRVPPSNMWTPLLFTIHCHDAQMIM